jgi:hypothetical protein
MAIVSHIAKGPFYGHVATWPERRKARTFKLGAVIDHLLGAGASERSCFLSVDPVVWFTPIISAFHCLTLMCNFTLLNA